MKTTYKNVNSKTKQKLCVGVLASVIALPLTIIAAPTITITPEATCAGPLNGNNFCIGNNGQLALEITCNGATTPVKAAPKADTVYFNLANNSAQPGSIQLGTFDPKGIAAPTFTMDNSCPKGYQSILITTVGS